MQCATESIRAEGVDSLDWYAAYVKHQHEKKAADHLQRKGVEVLLPLQKVVHRWKDRNKVLLLPIFPSYLFIHTNLLNRWEILNTPGVFFLIESQGRAARIPLQEIESMRRLIASGFPAQPHRYLSSGDRLRVCSGPLEGVIGILDRYKNQYRVVINIELLHKAVSVEVALSDLERTQDYGEFCSGDTDARVSVGQQRGTRLRSANERTEVALER